MKRYMHMRYMHINGICSQVCPASPCGFCQFCGAGQGLLHGARQPVFSRGGVEHPWYVQVERIHRGPLYGYYGMCRLLFCTHTPSSTGDYTNIQRVARCLIALSDLWSFVCVPPNMKVTFLISKFVDPCIRNKWEKRKKIQLSHKTILVSILDTGWEKGWYYSAPHIGSCN